MDLGSSLLRQNNELRCAALSLLDQMPTRKICGNRTEFGCCDYRLVGHMRFYHDGLLLLKSLIVVSFIFLFVDP
jgi:hypothetical protein